jgi:hypothetical protein
MLHEWAIVGTRDEFTGLLVDRCGDLYDTVLLDLPTKLWRDEDWVRETVRALQRS